MDAVAIIYDPCISHNSVISDSRDSIIKMDDPLGEKLKKLYSESIVDNRSCGSDGVVIRFLMKKHSVCNE